MNNKDYFKNAGKIWEAYFETRKGRKYGEEAMSRRKREELLDEMRKTIKFQESRLDDKSLIKKIEEARTLSLENDVKNAFKDVFKK